ncbi:MAG: hypothetical protein P1V97_33960 [Planctomycetota bacterium]|nr:hypothetical protein [Planctomycetota bacterium]
MRTVEVDCNEDSDKRTDKQDQLVENFVNGGSIHHNFKMSHDNKKFISFGHDGLLLVKGREAPKTINVILYQYEVIWDPTNRYVAFMSPTPEGENLMMIDTAGEEPSLKTLYTLKRPGSLRGIEWSPKGGEIYWIEQQSVKRVIIHSLKRININSKNIKTLVEGTDIIDFFMPPVTWFQYGQGAQSRPYSIVYGTRRGLFTISADGSKRRYLTEAPAVGVTNLEWSLDGKKIIIYFHKSFKSMKHGLLKGVVLAHLDKKDPKAGSQPPAQLSPKEKKSKVKISKAKAYLETLYDGKKIHTLWFSPAGKWVMWIKEEGCWYRDPNDIGKAGIKIPNPVIEDEDGNLVEITDKSIKGAIWNNDENRLAITAGNQVWIYSTVTKKTELYYEFGGALSHFLGEPRWRGDKLILTIFEDTSQTGREAPRPKGENAEKPDKAIAEMYSDKRKFLKAERNRIEEARKAKEKAKSAKKNKEIEKADAERRKREERERKKLERKEKAKKKG